MALDNPVVYRPKANIPQPAKAMLKGALTNAVAVITAKASAIIHNPMACNASEEAPCLVFAIA